MSADSRQQVLWCYLDRTAFRKAASETLLIARFAAGFFALAVVADFRIRGGIALFKFQKILDGYCGNIAERLFCEERLMRGDNDIWHRDQPYQCVIFNNFLRAVLIEQVDLFFVHVQSRSSDFMAFQPFNEHFRIYQSAAGCVDNHNAGLHAGDSGVVDHMPGLVGQRAVQRDDVRLAQKLRQIHIGKVAGRVRKFIIVQHTHIEALADIRENAADFARADDADGFAVQIEARQTEIEARVRIQALFVWRLTVSSSAIACSATALGEYAGTRKTWSFPKQARVSTLLKPAQRSAMTRTPILLSSLTTVEFTVSLTNTERSLRKENLEDFLIGGTYRPERDTMESYLIGGTWKGGGSAYSGNWRPNPNKPYDGRYIGVPGEIKRTFKDGYWVDTKIGDDGRAIIERHYTDHCRSHTGHTNPHDHIISWDNPTEHPHPGAAINYPNGAPEFKQWREVYNMKYTISPDNTPEQNRFVSISDFKDCLYWGGEVAFLWKGIKYGVMRYGISNMITIYQMGHPESDTVCKDADEALEFMVTSDQLCDVITQVTVLDRSI